MSTTDEQFISNISQIEITANRISKYLEPGLLIALVGILGAGKTTLIRTLLEIQGVSEPTASPTFAYLRRLARKSDGQIFFHADLYRIESIQALDDLGILEALEDRNAISLVEWPELILEHVAHNRPILIIRVEHLSEEERLIKLIHQPAKNSSQSKTSVNIKS